MSKQSLVELFWQLRSEERFQQFKTPDFMAGELGLTPSRVRALVDEDKLPAIKSYGRIYIHAPGVFAILQQQNGQQI